MIELDAAGFRSDFQLEIVELTQKVRALMESSS